MWAKFWQRKPQDTHPTGSPLLQKSGKGSSRYSPKYSSTRSSPGGACPMDIDVPRKPRIILGASGHVIAEHFEALAKSLCSWAEVNIVATNFALPFIQKLKLPTGSQLYTDDSEWTRWKKLGDNILHIELAQWADAMIIAPASMHTLAKVATGLCDSLLTCIVRAWDFNKHIFIAPLTTPSMWNNNYTRSHFDEIDELGIRCFLPSLKKSFFSENKRGPIEDPIEIDSKLRHFLASTE